MPLPHGQADRYSDALADARRAHELNPNDTVALQVLGQLEAVIGDPKRAIEHLEQVLRLNPRQPRHHITYNMLAHASFGAKQYVDGADWASRAINERPEYLPRTCSSRSALSAWARSTKRRPHSRRSGAVTGILRDRVKGDARLRSARGSRTGRHVSAYRRRPRRPKRGRGAAMREQRRLAVIVAVGVIGYSRLMGRDESGTSSTRPLRPREHLVKTIGEREVSSVIGGSAWIGSI